MASSSSAANIWVLLGLGLAGIFLMTRRLKKTIREDFGAFVQRLQLLPPPQPAPPKAPHPLTSFSFAVSDIFDIDGYVTGFGNPDWATTHEAASWTSSAVSTIVEGGATCIGKTVIDEMAYSINGENKHYGTPTNPAAHARFPGGCSSGSAVAVAAELVDFSLGVDSVGGVRVPGAFCGILGFRPSHGAVSNIGAIPVSPSLDTVGWFAKDPSILRRVGHVLLRLPYADSRLPRHIIIADDCFQLLKIPTSRVAQVVTKSTEKLFGRQVLNHANLGDYLASKVPSLKHFHSKNRNGELKVSSLRSLANAMQFLQRHEFKNCHEEWINTAKPVLDPFISSNMHAMLDRKDANIDHCESARNETRLALSALLKDDGILVIPTLADPPPKLGAKEVLSDDYQTRAFSLLAIASMSGCCQVTIPLGTHDKCPVSVSFIARHGGDRFLLDTVQTVYASLQEQADIAAKSNLSNNIISPEESAEIAKEKGNIAFKEKQWQKAIGFYTEAIKLDGKKATYYSNRAAAYLELGSFLQAEADCTTAINLEKKNVKAYLRRGTAREMLGYYKEAIEDFRYALVLEPTNKTANLAANRLKKLFQ
ncbi:translocon at the outer membrane of chloroplasts 64 isoform X1 [Magnolia sinica]|uniref:translocon at the outer membrane of chloroplasts 64 isoform X1 n=1 Tax=Magnolia sinica TaxID=86752 RepID=UPI002657DCF3|nr:translocon at the outer membrane of chloroplasts 64 isoform X1 [Magnolia sinica]